jgi:glycosyltransferase involved in cell wall biosynthesis
MSTKQANDPASRPGISVILCTYNGAARLPETLRHLAAQQLPGRVAWEVLLIDNASTDNTAEVARQAARQHPGLPLRVLREPVAGKIHALTRGFREAVYAYYVVCDDDCWLPPDYLRVAHAQMTAHPEAGIMNGPYQNVYDAEPPAWYRRMEPLVALNTLGDRRLDITDDPGSIWGAGMVLRRRAYEELLAAGFTPALTGGLGAKRSAGEDTELCLAARLLGYRIVYEPALHFRHFVTAGRMQWQTLVHIARANGAASISYSAYRYHYARLHGKAYPGHTHWRTELRANLKFVVNLRTWLRFFFGRAEGNPAVLRTERQLAKVKALLAARGAYDASFATVGRLAGTRTAPADNPA